MITTEFEREVHKMANLIKIYGNDTVEYQRLKLFRDNANRLLYNASKAISIKEMYFDMGQDWMYTGLIFEDFKGNSSYQAFCPRDYELIVSCDSISKIMQMATYYAEENIKGNWNYKNNLYSKFE